MTPNATGIVINPFGPLIYTGIMNDDVLNELQTHSETVRASDNTEWTLGHLCSENVFTHLHQHLRTMLHCTEDLTKFPVSHFNIWDVAVDNLGMVLQYAHHHSPVYFEGMFSFMIYLSDTRTPSDKQDGMIHFSYGEQGYYNFVDYYHTPKVGELLMFPSWLRCDVQPFAQESAETLRLAGNWNYFDNPEKQT